MTAETPISALWPDPSPTPLDDDALVARYRRADAPRLRMNFVTSVDGAVSLDGYSAGLSGEPDKRVFGLLRMLCDALLVAAGTLRHEGYRAIRLDERRRAWRRTHGLAEYPTLVVVSGSLDLDPTQAAFADAPVRPVVLTCDDAPAAPELAAVADLVHCGAGRVDLAVGLAELRRRGLDQVLCEGGPQLFGALTAADLVDEMCLSVAPLLAGAGAGRITAGAASPQRHLPLRHVLLAGDGTLLLRHARH
ncbi:pyrimidine reductase family protein [Micromonospora sp. NPDC051196]|uniref:pyrimidine reductase family protein n=1 Tax=Micromonospora sp. NPDC051196 TaxID=3155281 RepID=UPI003449D3EB